MYGPYVKPEWQGSARFALQSMDVAGAPTWRKPLRCSQTLPS